MTRRVAIFGILVTVVLLLAPGATAQTDLEDALSDMRFEEVELVVGPSAVTFNAKDFRVQGEAASQFRTCVDGHDDCPIAELRGLIGNGDGTVTEQEASDFRELVLGLWSGIPEIRQFVESLKPLVQVDGRAADVVSLQDLRVDGAEGPTATTAPVIVDFTVVAEYRETAEADRHDIRVERVEQDITLTDWIVVRAADGWKISEDSIAPDSMARLYDDGKLQGSQDDFEGQEALTFQIEQSNSRALLWAASGLVLAAAAGLTFFFVYKRRQS